LVANVYAPRHDRATDTSAANSRDVRRPPSIDARARTVVAARRSSRRDADSDASVFVARASRLDVARAPSSSAFGRAHAFPIARRRADAPAVARARGASPSVVVA